MVIRALLQAQAKWMKRHLSPQTQLLIWVAIWDICWPLYFLPILTGGSPLNVFIYELSVGALHFTAQTGVTAAETLVETSTDPSLQEVAESTETMEVAEVSTGKGEPK